MARASTALAAALLPAIALFCSSTAAQPPDIGNAFIEERQLALLARVEDRGTALSLFTSDGCSGGMSVGWSWLAEHQPHYRALLGQAPPWEACCVIHDWAYWRGGSADGYARRLAADTELHRCVVATGQRRAPALATRLQIAEQTVVSTFEAAADLMFVAVRAGGAPCTPLPWRWGYGYPPCPVLAP